jgi:hypothetical protein
MSVRRVAAALVALGLVALAARLTPGDGWLWVALASVGFLYGYARQRVRALLVVGALLAGLSGGLLIGGLGVAGGFWAALGVAIMAIDRVEPEPDKRTFKLGAAVTAFGLLYGVAASGWLDDLRFAIVIVLAAILLWGGRARGRTW